MGLKHGKGLRNLKKKKKKRNLPRYWADFLHCVISLGFHSLSPQGCDKIFYQVFRR